MATPDSGAEAMDSRAEVAVTQDSGAEEPTAANSAGRTAAVESSEVKAAASENSGSDAMTTPDSEEATDVGTDSPDGKPMLLSTGWPSRSTKTQTEPAQPTTQTEPVQPTTPPLDADDDPGTDDDQLFPVRRAVSDWALLDRSPSTAHIRSGRIRRTAQMFEDLALAQEERQAAFHGRRSGRRSVSVPVFTAVPSMEREVLLVPLPAPPPEQSRRVNAILALGSGGPPAVDSDAEGDEEDDEMLWEKVRAKIAARRSKFQRLESRQDGPEPSRPATAKQNPCRLSADRTSWLTNGKQAAAPSKQQVAAPSKQQVAAPSKQQVAALANQKRTALAEQEAQQQPAKPVRVLTVLHTPTQNGHAPEATRSSAGKYIEQSEEQQVLRSLGSAVLARQKLASKEKARDQLKANQSEAERRLKKVENQRTDAQNRLEKTKGKLTRDSAFERKGLEALISCLSGTIREETRKADKLAGQIADADAGIEELRRRAAT